MKTRPLVFLSVLAATCMWLYFFRVMQPTLKAEAARTHNNGRTLGDLFSSWYGAKQLFLSGENPYGEKVSGEIQTAFYGTPSSTQPRDEQRFAYPVYVVFLLRPFVTLSFDQVQLIFSIFLLVSIAVSVVLWSKFMELKLGLAEFITLEALVLSCHPTVQLVWIQQLSGFVILSLAASVFLFHRRQFLISGVFLALATLKPQMAVLPVAWLCFISITHWKECRHLITGFLGSLTILVIAGNFLVRGWILDFVRAMQAYNRYARLNSVIGIFTGREVAILAGLIGLALLGVWSWRHRYVNLESEEFRISYALALAFTAVFMPTSSPYNQLLTLPAVFAIIKHWKDVRSRLSWPALSIGLIVVFWPWLGVALWLAYSFLGRIGVWWTVPFYLSLLCPVVILYFLVKTRVRRWKQSAESSSMDCAELVELNR
jgi:hypothetical protein